MLNRKIREMSLCVEETADALTLDGTKEDAKNSGAEKEWRSVSRRISVMRKEIERWKRIERRQSRNSGDIRERFEYGLILSLPFLLWILKIAVLFGIISLAVYAVVN